MSKIEWTGITWNVTTGCNKVSAGCKNCYAERMHKRLQGMGQKKYKRDFNKGVQLQYDAIAEAFKWRKPQVVFVDSMSDLFHEDVPFTYIRLIFGVMAVLQQHTFQVLTKRAERAAAFFTWMQETDPDYQDDPANYAYDYCVNNGIDPGCGSAFETEQWPLPNVIIGTSVENQETANERIPHLLEVPGKHFLSCEPLLGPLNISSWFYPKEFVGMEVSNLEETEHNTLKQSIHWVICGGESGPGARPMHEYWAQSLRDQCAAANVPFFFKQWGEYVSFDQMPKELQHAIKRGEERKHRMENFNDGKLIYTLHKIGKHKAGNYLDGKQHLNFPTI